MPTTMFAVASHTGAPLKRGPRLSADEPTQLLDIDQFPVQRTQLVLTLCVHRDSQIHTFLDIR